jgi:hypothetical protein
MNDTLISLIVSVIVIAMNALIAYLMVEVRSLKREQRNRRENDDSMILKSYESIKAWADSNHYMFEDNNRIALRDNIQKRKVALFEESFFPYYDASFLDIKKNHSIKQKIDCIKDSLIKEEYNTANQLYNDILGELITIQSEIYGDSTS